MDVAPQGRDQIFIDSVCVRKFMGALAAFYEKEKKNESKAFHAFIVFKCTVEGNLKYVVFLVT